ncbi:DUF4240 domain-containing protein [Rugosimonospora africana]|uniref:DUF4240 domain-containing protein n=1 Tax=Rugosimonospora africana TaxID=556532 RepID=UPI001944F209|nr:DUF4240 domain-containing protein [Rugosimonospora africana]
MDIEGFWLFLERSARETTGLEQRSRWLEYRLGRIPRPHIVDFQVHLDAARRPIDTYAMWGAANQIMDGLCSGDAFWYFQPWLIGQGRHRYQHAAGNPDNLADVPAVRALAGRRTGEWANAEWPSWEDLAYIAGRVYDQITGQEDSIDEELAAPGHHRPYGPARHGLELRQPRGDPTAPPTTGSSIPSPAIPQSLISRPPRSPDGYKQT